jgi:hypothetical protein
MDVVGDSSFCRTLTSKGSWVIDDLWLRGEKDKCPLPISRSLLGVGGSVIAGGVSACPRDGVGGTGEEKAHSDSNLEAEVVGILHASLELAGDRSLSFRGVKMGLSRIGAMSIEIERW